MDRGRVYIVLWLVVSISGTMGLYRHTYSACYGITTENFIKASCPGDEKIVMDAVYAYAKPLSSGCPSTMISSVNASCCQHEEGDCGFEYDGFNKNTYYQNCHGLNACYWTPVAWANAPCNASVYPPRTNYMEVSFYCISENEVKDVSEDGSVNTTTAILLNPGYVSGNNTGSLPANSSFRCSISASCATTLKIQTLSLNFTKEGGICGQSLTISDGTNTQVLSCGSNTNFLPTDLQVANNTHYLEIQVNNTLSTDSGYFLLQIGDGNSNDPVTLGCGASVGEGRVAAEDLPECSNETASTDNSTIATTVSVPTTDSSGINSSRTMGQNHHTYSACYGTTTDSFIKASCPGDEKIVMDKIYAYAKPLSSGCPQTMTSSSNTSASCCQHEDGDCGFEYEGSNKNTYYQNCHALTACYWTPVAWANTPCNTSVYPPRTNYMEVSFFCISENEVKDVSEDGSVNTTTAILLNPGYVSGNDTGSLPANSSFRCSISATCVATLKIQTLSLNFTKEGGICGQSLTISDGTNTQVLSCDNNTNFLPSDLQVINNTYYLEIQVNNTLGTDAGYFLLQIGDGNSNDPVTLGCGASVGEGRVAAGDLPECSNETTSTDNSTITTTVSVPTTDSSGTDSNRTMGKNRHTYSACYGTTTDSFIKASCPGDEKIVMDKIYTYAKPLSSGCPQTMTSSSNTSASCCQHEDGDCGFEYEGSNKNTYYENCHALTACYWTPVSWANTPCNTSVYPPRTNYMEVSFFCISENEVKDVSEDGSVNTTTAILLNPGYVSGNDTGSLPANSSFRCSISATCAATLKIRTLSLNFTKEGGICGQSLTISDGTNTQVLSCDNNTNFLPSDLYVANNTYYLEIQVNNTLGTDAGYFLLQIGDGGDDPVTLACGTSVGEGKVAAGDLPECSNKTVLVDNSTITKTISEPTTDSSGTESSVSQDESNLLGIIIGVVGGVLLMAFVGALFFRKQIKDQYIKRCKNGIQPDTEKNPSELEAETLDENYLFGPFRETVLPQVAPVSALMQTRLPSVSGKHNLPPIIKTSLIKGNRIESEIHTEKKTDNEKRKKKKRKKNKKKKIFDDVTKIDDSSSSIKPTSTTVNETVVS